MRLLDAIGCGLLLILTGCASTSELERQYTLTPEASKLVKAQGAATAAERGMANDTELVCETRKKLGSHMVERFCYTRVQGDKARLNAQKTMRDVTRGGPRIER